MRQVVVGLMTNRPSISPSKVPPKGGHGGVGTARRVATDDSQVSIQLPAPIVFVSVHVVFLMCTYVVILVLHNIYCTYVHTYCMLKSIVCIYVCVY